MITISILRETDKGQKTITLTLSVIAEAWFDNSLYLIVEPAPCQFECANDRALVFEQNPYYAVFGSIDINNKNYLVVKPKKTVENRILNPQEILSDRELQVAELVAYGKSNKQIAKKLEISKWTVSTHLRRIFIKLKVDSRASMVYHCASLIRYRMEQFNCNKQS